MCRKRIVLYAVPMYTMSQLYARCSLLWLELLQLAGLAAVLAELGFVLAVVGAEETDVTLTVVRR